MHESMYTVTIIDIVHDRKLKLLNRKFKWKISFLSAYPRLTSMNIYFIIPIDKLIVVVR